MTEEKAIIIGGGPCGLSAAIHLKQIGINALVIEKGNVVNSIYNYPTHQTFFSSSEKLEIGDVAFITENRKPVRIQALSYYREVARRKELRVNAFEKVERVTKQEDGRFLVETSKDRYLTPFCIIATGYYDHPNYMNIPGEELPKVFHYFKEGHPYFDKDVAVIGGKNSSVDAALELVKSGARVTVLYRGNEYSPSIKPWILPEFEALVRNGTIRMEFGACLEEVTEDEIIFRSGRNETVRLKNDFVFAMTGYHPDHGFLKKIGVRIDEESGRPFFREETMETNVDGVFIAGVIAAGNNANEIFIENGRFHGGLIAAEISKRLGIQSI
ncbi:YpdA family putative bacillithiol disulfide reductase [Bacillus sp. ISL-51]|uniref:YpdA family putative bacillithiol disulfide reductase n=1 Tax=Bacteria TaxID=2 RepID=UPI001BEB6433|nr:MULTISPECIES: YpdA family putative bacillithiol disulfide reductase [Bacteria]MBT2575489.1 YpdA family putative bacillithiol disulfide reductase [Bacillus sp. ISL-51]MBT2713126.1 YpdA family putative bacillithiol disulfide reductase [Pseudomonas sp. ISL-88]